MIPDDEFTEDAERMPTADSMYHNYLRLGMDESNYTFTMSDLRRGARLFAGDEAEMRTLEHYFQVLKMQFDNDLEQSERTRQETVRRQEDDDTDRLGEVK